MKVHRLKPVLTGFFLACLKSCSNFSEDILPKYFDLNVQRHVNALKLLTDLYE